MSVPELERQNLLAVVRDQLRRYPEMKSVDLYKLLYQATFGGEHLLEHETDAKKSLNDEWNDLDKVQKGEALLEPIDPNGEVLRVNLRVYRKTGGTPQALFSIFRKSSGEFQKDEERLNAYFRICIEAAGREIPFRRKELEDLYDDLGRRGFPPIHHSKAYRETHKPAYRIVLKRYWQGFNEDPRTKHE